MTDNFQRYKELITLCGGLPDDNEKGNLDRYYVVELMRRGKDNPDLPAANYHFRNYYIYSWRDLDRYEKEIKQLCNLLNLRAYGSVGSKRMSQVALDTLAESARRIAAHDYKRFYSTTTSVSTASSSPAPESIATSRLSCGWLTSTTQRTSSSSASSASTSARWSLAMTAP